MSMNSVLADTLARLKNAQKANKSFTLVKFSKKVMAVLEVLKNEGYIEGYQEIEQVKGIKLIKVDLKYYDNLPVIKELRMVSKPGCKSYSGVEKLIKPFNGLGVLILSTSKGIMPDHEARDKNVGGELLCIVY